MATGREELVDEQLEVPVRRVFVGQIDAADVAVDHSLKTSVESIEGVNQVAWMEIAKDHKEQFVRQGFHRACLHAI